MKITFKNDFHHTTVSLVTRDWTLSPWQVRRAKRALCSSRYCACGGDIGQRGMQPNTIQVYARPDGSAMLLPGPCEMED